MFNEYLTGVKYIGGVMLAYIHNHMESKQNLRIENLFVKYSAY